ncbi:hypothetical protein M3J09_003999 [Ascochyta lentis]
MPSPQRCPCAFLKLTAASSLLLTHLCITVCSRSFRNDSQKPHSHRLFMKHSK